MCGCSFLISSDSYLFKTCKFTNKTPQIAEEKLVMTMDKAQETKLQSSGVAEPGPAGPRTGCQPWSFNYIHLSY